MPVELFRRFRMTSPATPPDRGPGWLEVVASVLAIAVVALAIVRDGLVVSLGAPLSALLAVADWCVLAAVIAEVVIAYARHRSFRAGWQHHWFDTLTVLVAGGLIAAGSHASLAVIVRQGVALGRRLSQSEGLLDELQRRPVALLAVSFGALITLGTVLLMLPASTTDGNGTGLVNAIFTAGSAVCVTGLTVVDTGSHFSRFGQSVILALIQLGGLGIMTFYAGLAAVVGGRLGITQRRTMAAMVEEPRHIQIGRTLRYVVLLTVLAESAGAGLLLIRWRPDFGSLAEAAYQSVFHSVSAFCNAGFSLHADNLVRYQADPAVNLVIMALIVAGGLGFSVLHEVFSRRTLRLTPAQVWRGLSVHARLVLWTSGLLIAAGAALFFILEYGRALAGLPLGTKLLASLFQAVTPRTAGFNTVPLNALRPVTVLIWVVLMYIGASPGGTGGGIKTSTAAVLFLTIRSRVTGRNEVEYGGRTIDKDTVYRAASVAALGAAALGAAFAVLLLAERQPFADLLFETASAFGTVGLSTGITPALSDVGKLALTVLMYVGRVGPLTMVLIMQPNERRLPISYPRARVMVG
ncbi:hypothetical protein FJY71_02790 [candidate division WOR-3 bacterium]|nr:hypothetical protein [candidate division WOR-3 bacterium]